MYRSGVSVEEAGLVKVEVLIDFFLFLTKLRWCGPLLLVISWLLKFVAK